MPRLLVATTVADTLRAFLLPYARHFRAKGYVVEALARGAGGCSACRDAFDAVHEAPWSRGGLDPHNPLSLRVVRQLLQRQRYDLVHVHTPIASVVMRLAAASLGRRRPLVIYTAHGFHFVRGGLWLSNAVYLGIETLAAPWTDALVVINREDEQAALKQRLISRARLHYMPGIGIDLTHFSPQAVSDQCVADTKSTLALVGPHFVVVAQIMANKRHSDAIAALARLARSSVQLVFAGDGPLRERFARQARDLGVQRQVRFVGHMEDVRALVRGAVATVLPSEREGLSRAVMESLALEVPVIGSDARGIRDLLDGGVGLVVPIGDVEALARAMERLLDQPELAGQLARAGRARVAECALPDILAQHEALYARVLESPRRM